MPIQHALRSDKNSQHIWRAVTMNLTAYLHVHPQLLEYKHGYILHGGNYGYRNVWVNCWFSHLRHHHCCQVGTPSTGTIVDQCWSWLELEWYVYNGE